MVTDSDDLLSRYLPSAESLLLLGDFFRTLGEPSRLKILFSLSHKEMSVNQLAEAGSQTPSAVSHQLALLKKSGLITFRKQGREVIYRLDDSHVHGIIQLARDHLSEPRSLS